MRKSLFLALIMSLLLAPELTQANGLPTSGKAGGGYHPVPLKSETVSVISELLTFDFSFLAEHHPGRGARATAAYWLHNHGQEQEIVSVAFIYIGQFLWEDVPEYDEHLMAKRVSVSLDSTPLAMEVRQVPDYTFDHGRFYKNNMEVPEPGVEELLAGLEGSSPVLHAAHNHIHVILFDVVLEAGQTHQLEVSFPQAISWEQKMFGANFTAHYFLDPASYWKDFNDLTIQVVLPEGFHLEARPGLTKTSSTTWQGEFSTLPSENLTLSMRPRFPASIKYGTWNTGIGLFLLAFYGGLTLLLVAVLFALRAVYRRISVRNS